jgi:GAF domain-containing protein
MRRRSKASGKPAKARRRKAVTPKVARLTPELSEALDQQAATSEVLRIISSSPTDVQPVFDTIARSAARLCKAQFCYVFRFDGMLIHFAAQYGLAPKGVEAIRRVYPIVPGRASAAARSILNGTVEEIPDIHADHDYEHAHTAKIMAYRSIVAVPMLKDGRPIGAVAMARSQTGRFPGRQVELLKTFADQAVIAIENVRLFEAEQQRTRELSESLEQQTATSEVLKVISRSTFDLQAVFGTLIESAVRLCEARFGAIFRLDHDLLHLAAQHNFPESQLALLQGEYPMTLNRGHISGRAVLTGAPVQIPDTLADQEYRGRASKEANFRSLLAVPLMRGGQAIGAIVIYRIEPGIFADKQLALLQTFADQAVIAIENVRLFEAGQQHTRELTESLDQQTATSEILKVISSSPGQLKPVFQSILGNATRICEASFGTFLLLEGDSFRRVALHNAPAKYAEFSEKDPLIHRRHSVTLNRIIETKQPDHVADMRLQEVDSPIAKHGGARTLLTVPMLKENELLGTIGIYRQEVRPFTDKQIKLVANFAAQAVIAIENARLLNELRESLDQQTATSEVLRVISSSPGELKAVFQAMLENAVSICDATFGTLYLSEGSQIRGVAAHSKQSYTSYFQDNPVFDLKDNPGIPLDRAANTKQVVHIPDLRSDQSYIGKNPRIKQFVELGGARTTAVIPMLKEDELVGAIIIYRQEVRPFTEKQIDLVRNFAAQAVIAIENTRLLNELRESLEQQTATSEVLRVISSSPTNVQPVFDSIAESAVRLCGGQFSFVTRLDGNVMNFASCFGLSAEGLDAFRSLFPLPASDDTVSGRAILQRTIVEIADVEADAAYGGQSQHLARTANYRSIVGVPLLHEGNPIGAIAVARAHAGLFPERQIALLQAFADQAVIAIRNVRLFDEVQARTNDLTESLEQQTATSEVLKVISNSVSDLQAVFDTMAENAVKLCEAERGYIFRFDGKLLQAVAAYNVGPENWEYVSQNPIAPGRQTVSARAALERRTVQVTDVQTDPEYTYVARDVEPIHSVLAVPILKGDELVGTITIYRLEIKPFTDKQIALVETFAAQAVIAIENTRLLTELRESLQQTATADVLKAISRSTFDLNTVLRTLVEAAARLCEADQGTIAREQDGVFVRVATYGFSAEFTEIVTHMAVTA